MRCSRLVLVALLLAVLALSGIADRSAAAAPSGTPDAVALCKSLAHAGVLTLTIGECVNVVKDSGTNSLAGACGSAFVQQLVGTDNKGQCLKVLKQLNG